MRRLFGLSAGEERIRAAFWLLEMPDSLTHQSRREPVGAGLGTFVGGAGGAVAHLRRPRPLRSTGEVSPFNPHPFPGMTFTPPTPFFDGTPKRYLNGPLGFVG